MKLLRASLAQAGHATAGEPIDPLLEDFANGLYNGGHFKAYSGRFPHIGTDPLLVSQTLPTPAIGSIVSPTELILAAISGASILVESLSNEDKYGVISKSDGSGKIYLSIDISANSPDCVVSTTDWYAGETVDIDGIHIIALDDVLNSFLGTVSTASPETAGAYTTNFTAVNNVSAVVPRIGITLTSSYVGTGGSISESSIISDAGGVFETIHNTAGTTGDPEHVSVTDGVITSNGPTATPVSSQRDLTWTTLGTGGETNGGTVLSALLSVPAGDMIVVCKLDLHNTTPVLTDSSGTPLGSPPFTFIQDATVTGDSGGKNSIFSSGVLASTFNGKILLDGAGASLGFVIVQAHPNLACSIINAIPANTIVDQKATGTLAALTLTYAQTISNIHNSLFAAFGNYGPENGAFRPGWTEIDQFINSGGANVFAVEVQYKNGNDSIAKIQYSITPSLLYGCAVEYQALP